MKSLPPQAIRAAITAGPETGEILGALQTAGEHAFVHADGRWWRAPIWWVVTDRHTWLAAAHEDATWAVATGEPRDVGLDLGWARDSLRVGSWSIPLRRGTRKAAQSLLATWEKARWGGAAWPSTPPADPGRAPLAAGADGFPDGWAEAVPGDPAERWLLAGVTSATQPFSLYDGSVREETIWLGVSDRRIVLAALADDLEWSTPVDAPIEDPEGARRTRYRTGSRRFGAPARRAPLEAALRLARRTEPAARWASAAELALEHRAGRRALLLLQEARALGRDARIDDALGRILLAVGRPALAAAALAEHLRRVAEVEVTAGPGRWAATAHTVARALRRDGVDEEPLREHATALLDALDPVEPPGRLPWPPAGETEVWIAALAARRRFEDARTLLAGVPHDPRGEAVRAAILTAAGATEAAAAWERAARSAREQGADAEAVAAVDRSLEIEETPSARWLAAAWAWADDRAVEARRHWGRALELDPSGQGATRDPLPVDAECALARIAERSDRWEAARDAWTRARDADPTDLDTWKALVRILEEPLADPAAAAAVRAEAARAADEGPLEQADTPPRWALWADVARLRAAAGDARGGVDACLEALSGDFLRPEAYGAVLAVPALDVPPALRGWWGHLARLVEGARQPEGTPLAPHALLDDETLDRLHPGGAGWLEEIRTSIDTPDPPPRSLVVRGLERLRPGVYPEIDAVIEVVAQRLGLPDPPPTYLYRGDGAWGASAWPVEPPAVLLGHTHVVEGPRHLSPTGLAFLLAVEFTHLRCDHPVLAFDRDLLGTSRSVYAAFGRYAGTAEAAVDVLALIPGVDQLARLQHLIRLARRMSATRGAVNKVAGLASQFWDRLRPAPADPGALAREGLTGAALQFRIQADRAALLVTGDARAAVEAILRGSTASVELADRVDRDGLAAVLHGLQADDTSLPPDEALRITMLVEFATRQRPALSEGALDEPTHP